MYEQLLTKSSGPLPRSQLPWGDVEIVVREPGKTIVSEAWDLSHYLESHGIIGIGFLLHLVCLSCHSVFFGLVFKSQIMDDIGG